MQWRTEVQRRLECAFRGNWSPEQEAALIEDLQLLSAAQGQAVGVKLQPVQELKIRELRKEIKKQIKDRAATAKRLMKSERARSVERWNGDKAAYVADSTEASSTKGGVGLMENFLAAGPFIGPSPGGENEENRNFRRDYNEKLAIKLAVASLNPDTQAQRRRWEGTGTGADRHIRCPQSSDGDSEEEEPGLTPSAPSVPWGNDLCETCGPRRRGLPPPLSDEEGSEGGEDYV
jgi:hypothetical protein